MRPGPRLAGALVLAAALTASVAVFHPALDGSFISDDKALILGNPAIRSVERSLSAFERSYWGGLKNVAPYYRPVPLISYAIEYSLVGRNPALYHWTNVLLHGANAALAGLLVFGLSRAAAGPGGTPEPPFLAGLAVALLAAVHPLHSEPVAAVYGRPDLLAAFFALLFLNLSVRGRSVYGCMALAGALLSKESALGLPLLAPFALVAGRRAIRLTSTAKGREADQVGPGPLWSILLPAAVLGGYLFLRHEALGGLLDPSAVTRIDNPLVDADPLSRLAGAAAVLGRYASLWIWPASLCADRGFDATPAPAGFLDPRLLAGGAILLGGAAMLVFLSIRRSPWAVPLAGAGLAYLPASNLVLLAPAQMAERFAYLPSILLLTFAGGWLVRMLSGRGRGGSGKPGWPYGRHLIHLGLLTAVAAFGARSYVRAGEFRNDLVFYASGSRSCPDSAKSRFNHGNALLERGRYDEAAAEFEAAVRIAPWLAVAQNNLGHAHLNARRLEEAEAAFREAVKQDPDLLQPRLSLAGILYLRGKLGRALIETRAALALHPDASEREKLESMEEQILRRLGKGEEGSP